MNPLFEVKCLTCEAVREMLDAAILRAGELGIKISVAVVDGAGLLLGFLRMEGSGLITVDMAIKKARSAASYGRATREWFERCQHEDVLYWAGPDLPGVVALGGGYPVKVGEQTIGGIGVSGGHFSQDMDCAEAALARLEKMLSGKSK